jgi:transposase-like protein
VNTYGVDLMGRRHRRRHTAEFKAAVIQECLRPGVSIAAVALAHSLNANMLRKWVIDAEHKVMALPPAAAPESEPPSMPPPTFIPLALPAPTVDGEIRIELQRAGTVIKLVWPAAAARDCAAWLRDWLR